MTEEPPKRVKVRRVQRSDPGAGPTPPKVRMVTGSGCLTAVLLGLIGLAASVVAVVVLVVSGVISLVNHATKLLFGGGSGGRNR